MTNPQFDSIEYDIEQQRDEIISIIKSFRRYGPVESYIFDRDIHKVDSAFSYLTQGTTTKRCHPVCIEKDGNCLYRAVACAVKGQQDDHEDLRRAAIFVLIEYRSFFERLVSVYDEHVTNDYAASFERFVVEHSRNGMFVINVLFFCVVVSYSTVRFKEHGLVV